MIQDMTYSDNIVQNAVEIIILVVFFPTITSKYLYHLSKKTSFISFDIIGLRDPHFHEIDFCIC